MSTTHGINIVEKPTALTIPREAGTVVVAVGTAMVNMTDDPLVNEPTLVTSATEAQQLFGYSTTDQSYTLNQVMYTAANIFQIQPLVFINVLDPAKHHKDLPETTVQVDMLQAKVSQTGILKEGLVVATGGDDSHSLSLGTDYTLTYDTTGELIINLFDDGLGASAASLVVSGKQLDPSAVTKEDIIGGYNQATGQETGLQLIRQIRPRFDKVASLLIAPGFSQIPEVGIAMAAKMGAINGIFRGMALIDLDTDRCRKYQDTKTQKEAQGAVSTRVLPLWPQVKVGDLQLPASAVMGPLMAYLDAQNENVPYRTPSNIVAGITGTALADGTPVILDQEQATVVDEYGITTFANLNGWRTWGGYTGDWPGNTDPKDAWICMRRMMDWIGNHFVLAYFSHIDRPYSRFLIEDIVYSENKYLEGLTPDYLAYGEIAYLSEDNTETDIISGHLTVATSVALYPPARVITNKLSFNTKALRDALLAA